MPSGGEFIQVETIVTLASLWPARPESSDPAWKMFPNVYPLVISQRAI